MSSSSGAPGASRPSMLDVLSLGALAGLVAVIVDLAAAQGPLLAPTVPPGDALAVALATLGLVGLAGALGAGVVVGVARAVARGRRASLGATVASLAAAAPLVAWNLGLARRLGAGGLAGLAVVALLAVAAGVVLDRLHRAGKGPWLALPAIVVALVATGLNAAWFPGLYRPQHASLAWLSLGALGVTCAAASLRAPWLATMGRGALGAALLAATSALAGWPLAPGANARVILARDTLVATHAVDAVAAASDWDRDGTTSLLGGADCGPFDAAVHPGARDVPDDGLDQDCLGGDATADGLAALKASRGLLADPVTPPSPARPVIVLSIDALRTDRAAGLTGVQRLAARGVSFARAQVAYPSTILSFYAMFTGRAPSAVATRRVLKWDVPQADGSATFAEALVGAGYSTTGLFFHHLFALDYGITRGFQRLWVESADPQTVVWGVSSLQTADRALQALGELGREGRPFLLWVHFYDPHEPYVVHADQPVADPSDYGQLYDGEVRFTDVHLTRLVDALITDGWTDRALIVLLGDHGESLGEQGRLFHNSSLTDEQVRVPLVMVGPGLARGAVRETPVSLQDLPDTLCQELGLPRLRDSQGASFRRLLRQADPPPEQRPPVFFEVFAEAGRQRGVLRGPWKLVQHVATGALELKDVQRDPHELLNVVDLAPGVAAQLAGLLSTWGSWSAGP